ncbi:MAG: hypothetical protein QXP45_03415 [Thermoproteota archaeon]
MAGPRGGPGEALPPSTIRLRVFLASFTHLFDVRPPASLKKIS